MVIYSNEEVFVIDSKMLYDVLVEGKEQRYNWEEIEKMWW